MMSAATVVDVDTLSGTIHPFSQSKKSLIHTFVHELTGVITTPEGKKIAIYILANILCTIVLLLWCNSTNSMALTAYTYLTIYDIFGMLTCLLSLWVWKQKPCPVFSFGYARFEVLAVFASTVLAILGSLFIIKESIERMVEQPEIHTGRLLVGTSLAFTFHMIVNYSLTNKAFNHVVEASSSSWLQEHMADMSEGLCHMVPGLSKLLLPRINPFSLIAVAGGLAIMVVYILIDTNNYFASDTWAAVWIAMMSCGTMFPMSVYSGKILLQTTPSHLIGQLDKVLREASTLDGVLEFRHEHFWTLAFGNMGGSVHVRVRRDADEQLVLAHVVNRLSNLISVLTVQVFKDDWTRSSSYQFLSDPTFTSGKPPSVSNPAGIRFPTVSKDVGNPIGKYYRPPPLSPTSTLPYSNISVSGAGIRPSSTRTSPLGVTMPYAGASRTYTTTAPSLQHTLHSTVNRSPSRLTPPAGPGASPFPTSTPGANSTSTGPLTDTDQYTTQNMSSNIGKTKPMLSSLYSTKPPSLQE